LRCFAVETHLAVALLLVDVMARIMMMNIDASTAVLVLRPTRSGNESGDELAHAAGESEVLAMAELVRGNQELTVSSDLQEVLSRCEEARTAGTQFRAMLLSGSGEELRQALGSESVSSAREALQQLGVATLTLEDFVPAAELADHLSRGPFLLLSRGPGMTHAPGCSSRNSVTMRS
jgi:hypothetical protein